ncbi:hypothetical protein HOD75_02050 [archaeon]|jgi:archaeal flagellar protein FlaJ|nr:hypothetical protein [archaeon]MBT4241659.1 hypothetical protein [archaeon]MBT4418054.1 hypothetical protein [archaeon]
MALLKLFRKVKKSYLIGLISAFVIIIFSILFWVLKLIENDLLYFILGISFVIGGLPFFISLIIESNITREKEEMFLEFARNLVESVKAGTPISRSILNVKNKDYGVLNPYVEKLANQISLGIPIKVAFETFARDVRSKTISRAVTIISESEKAGGQIEDILESVAKSVSQVEKLRKERRASMSTLVVQGYIIFLIFIVIMLVMEFTVLPIAQGLGEGVTSIDTGMSGGLGGFVGGQEAASPEELAKPFFWLLIVQGLFVGLVIGKLSEGKVKAGIKHSFILIVLALLINTGARLFL